MPQVIEKLPNPRLTVTSLRVPLQVPLQVGDTSMSAMLLKRLRENVPERRAQIEAALATDPPDLDAVAGQAHRLAGAAAYCGQETLQDVALMLEKAARSRHPKTVCDAWHELCATLDAL